MKVSYHAGERFLQRVIQKHSYTKKDIHFAIRYLEKSLQNVVPTGINKHFVLPEFQNYRAVYCQNTIVTIIPKGERVA